MAFVFLTGCGSTDATGTAAWPDGEPAWALQGDDGRAFVQVMAADGSGLRTLAPSLQGSQTNPDWSPDGGRVTFGMTDAGGKDDLWVVDVDGSNARRVYDCTGACDYIDDAAWSPDGETIAVCHLSDTGKNGHVGTGALIAVDVRTGAAKPLLALSPLDFCSGPRWSPDGSRIVLELVHRGGINLASSEVVGVTLAVLRRDGVRPTPRPYRSEAFRGDRRLEPRR